jgi:Dynamin family
MTNPAQSSSPKPGSGTGGPGELTRRFQRVVNQSLDEFRTVGRPDLVDEVAAEVARPAAARPVVLVAGETRRGKSTLINALLRHPGLSPGAPDVATTAYLVFSHGDQAAATVTIQPAGATVVSTATDKTPAEGVERRPITMNEIGTWATTEGNPANVREVLAVEVTLDASLLRSITLVDTPGHGGLESVTGSISVPIARQADAVVFVLDAGSPISAPELAFLHSVSARVDAVIVAVAKKDDYPGWSRIVEDDRELLRRYAPELANVPVIAVSAHVAEAAKAREPGSAATALWNESGLGELQRMLEQRVAARASLLRACNILVTARDGLKAAHGVAALGVAATRGEPGLKEAIEVERGRLRQYGSRWSHRVNAGIGTLKLAHGEELGRDLAELQRKYVPIIERSSRNEHEKVADQLVAELDQLAARLAETAGLAIAALVAEATAELDSEEQFHAIVDRASAAVSEHSSVRRVNKASNRQLTKVDKLAGFVSFSSGKSIAGIVTALPLIAGFGLPVIGVGLGVGALFSYMMTTSRQELNMQANLKAWLQAQITEAQRQISTDFGRRMISAQENLREAITDHLDQRRAELDRAAAAYAATGPGDQSGLRAAEADMARIAKLLGETDQILASLGAFRGPARKMVRAL